MQPSCKRFWPTSRCSPPLWGQVPGLVEVYDPAAQRCTFLLPLELREDLLRPSY